MELSEELKKKADAELLARAMASSEAPDLTGPNPFATPSPVAGRRMEQPVMRMDPLLVTGNVPKRDPFQPPPSNVAPTMKMAAMDIPGRLPGTGGSGVPDDMKAFAQKTAATPEAATAPVSYADKDLMDAQRFAANNRLFAGLARAGGIAAAGLNHQRLLDPGAFDALDQNADAPVKDYAAQKSAATANKAAAEAAALKDPNSAASKALQGRVAKMLPGMYSPDELSRITASDSDNVLQYGKMRSELDNRAKEQAQHDREFEAGEKDKKAQLGLGYSQLRSAKEDRLAAAAQQDRQFNTAQENKLAEEAAKNATELQKAKAAKDAAGTPLPPEAIKAVNQLQAVGALARLKKAHDETNGTGVLTAALPGNTAANRYNDQLQADSSALAAGILPQGRETPGAVDMIHGMVPGAMTGSSRALQQFKAHRDNLLGNARSQIQALSASGKYDKGQLAELNRQLAAAEEQGRSIDGDAGTGGSGAPSMPTRTDPETGETRAWDGQKWVPLKGG